MHLPQCQLRSEVQYAADNAPVSACRSSASALSICAASWQPEVIALASPVEVTGYPVYVVNMSVTGKDTLEHVAGDPSSALLALRDRIHDAMSMQLQGFQRR